MRTNTTSLGRKVLDLKIEGRRWKTLKIWKDYLKFDMVENGLQQRR